MELIFADTNQTIETGLYYPKAKFEAARHTAKKTGKVIEIKGQCIRCGTIAKPESEITLDEMFSWCCKRAERESILVRESLNKCDLCGKHSPRSVTHPKCHDRENLEMEYERAMEESI